MKSFSLISLWAFLLVCGSFCADATVQVNPLFGDHMALQRERPVPVWGRANPGEIEVAVAFGAAARGTAAEIRNRAMFVSSPAVSSPQTVRFAFSPAPKSFNFINSAGLPASPFRTDTQPVPPQH